MGGSSSVNCDCFHAGSGNLILVTVIYVYVLLGSVTVLHLKTTAWSSNLIPVHGLKLEMSPCS